MERTYSEKKVLKKLGITDFRHMTKEKIVNFVSLLPQMDPEVAKKALEQFPSFKDYAGDVVSQLGSMLDKIVDGNNVSQTLFYETCNSIIASLQKELEDDNISPDSRERIENKMIEVARMMGEKDSENKTFYIKIMSGAVAATLGAVAIVASVLGANPQVSKISD